MPRASTKKTALPARQKEDYLFFWTTSHINGWASQWYNAPFSVSVTIEDKEEIHQFPATENWMMLNKALLFSDIESARMILDVKSPGKDSMKRVKALGRKVKNFNDVVWKQNRERIVLEGNLHKFRQNDELKEKLLDTGDREIVEASPRDRVWGIGFGEKNALERHDRWGSNLLGKALMETRRILRGSEEGQTSQSVQIT